MDRERMMASIRTLLEAAGEDPDREGLRDTPRRVADSYVELLSGINKNPADELNTFFSSDTDEMVIVKDIPFYSMCEHHLLPFFGNAHVVYLPSEGRLTGLSKLARTVEVAARRPQLQERLTAQVADALMERLQPRGALVVMEAEHLCMTMRGIKKPGSVTVTSALRGLFKTRQETRAEALSLIGYGRA